MKTIQFSILFLTGAMLLMAGTVVAQEIDLVQDASDRVEEESGLSPVQYRGDQKLPVSPPPTLESLNVVDTVVIDPDEATERAASRYVTFTNRTPWYVHCYIAGRFAGTLAPHSRLSIDLAESGTYELFAYTRLSNDQVLSWGAISRYITGSYNMTLNNQ